MKKVAFTSNVLLFLDELILNLLENEYFGFEDSAILYVNWLYDAIRDELHSKTHHQTPLELVHYGKFYIKIKSNRKTVWYVFFDHYNAKFLVQFITNNHKPHSLFLNNL